MEAEKSQDQQSSKLETQESWWCSSGLNLQAWKPGEPIVCKFWSEGDKLDTKKTHVSVQVGKQEKTYVQVHGSKAHGILLTLRKVCLFDVFRTSYVWLRPIHIREGNLLFLVYWLIQMLISSENTLTDICRIMLD